MSEILEINESTVKIGNDDGTIARVPIGSLQFPNPKVGNQVRVYKDGSSFIVKLITNSMDESASGDRRKINKIAYILITFFLGVFGVHRFMRGQVGLGLLMLFFGWLTLYIWWLVDFIISLIKLSAYDGEDFIFTPDGRFVK